MQQCARQRRGGHPASRQASPPAQRDARPMCARGGPLGVPVPRGSAHAPPQPPPAAVHARATRTLAAAAAAPHTRAVDHTRTCGRGAQ